MATVIKTIKGFVRGGRIELTEGVDAPEGTEVSVQVPVAMNQLGHRQITFGMFARSGDATESDLQSTKSLWEREWEKSWDELEKQ